MMADLILRPFWALKTFWSLVCFPRKRKSDEVDGASKKQKKEEEEERKKLEEQLKVLHFVYRSLALINTFG